MKQFTLLIFLLNAYSILLGQSHISGTVKQSDNSLMPYVNIGIKSKNIGTVSDEKGEFELVIPKRLMTDTLTFSSVGFEEINIPVQSFLILTVKEFTLHQKTSVLEEVVIVNKKIKIKKIGTQSHNPFLSGAAESKDKKDIVEFAKHIDINGKASNIQSVSIYLLGLNIDTATFRINFYNEADDLPQLRIIEKSILQRVNIKRGWLTIDLSKYNIILKNNFFVGFEFLPERKISKYSFNYGAQLGGNSVARTSSLGKWGKFKGATLSAYVTVAQ